MISIESLISVSTKLSQSASPVQNTTNLLVLTGNTVINLNERYRSYTSPTAVATDFGENGPEYAAAALWFGQSPQPTTLLIGRWANVAAAGQLIGGAIAGALASFTGIADAGFTLDLNGVTSQISGLNFTQAVTLNGIANQIQTAIGEGVTVIWNAEYSRFEFTSGTVGAASTWAFLAPPTGGGVTDISALLGGTAATGALSIVGQAAETALVAATLFDANYGGKWYALVIPQAADADHSAVASFIQSTTRKHFYGVTSADPGCLVANSTVDVLYILGQLNLNKTMVWYSSSSSVAVVAALSLLLTVDYSGSNTVLTLAWKSLAGLTAENLTETQFLALEGKNGNALIDLDNGDSAAFPGTTVSTNVFADTMVGADNLNVGITQAVYGGLRGNPKVGQTDAGMAYLLGLALGVCAQFVTNGFLAAGTWNGPIFGALTAGETLSQGYYGYVAPVATQLESTRAARIAVPIQIAGKLSGAVHTGSVVVTLNP